MKPLLSLYFCGAWGHPKPCLLEQRRHYAIARRKLPVEILLDKGFQQIPRTKRFIDAHFLGFSRGSVGSPLGGNEICFSRCLAAARSSVVLRLGCLRLAKNSGLATFQTSRQGVGNQQ